MLILHGLGTFYANLFRSAVLYSIFEESGDSQAGTAALALYKRARAAWISMAERAKGVYIDDVSYGDIPQRHGHWMDRIPAIDHDLAAMEARVAQKTANPKLAATAIRAATMPVERPSIPCAHNPPAVFHPGSELPITLSLNLAWLFLLESPSGTGTSTTANGGRPYLCINRAAATMQQFLPPTLIRFTRCSITSSFVPAKPPGSIQPSTRHYPTNLIMMSLTATHKDGRRRITDGVGTRQRDDINWCQYTKTLRLKFLAVWAGLSSNLQKIGLKGPENVW